MARPIEQVLKEIFEDPYAGDDIKTRVAEVYAYIKKLRAKIERQRIALRHMEEKRHASKPETTKENEP
jgi:hypothetical protein